MLIAQHGNSRGLPNVAINNFDNTSLSTRFARGTGIYIVPEVSTFLLFFGLAEMTNGDVECIPFSDFDD